MKQRPIAHYVSGFRCRLDICIYDTLTKMAILYPTMSGKRLEYSELVV